jgi:hypothetical protein
VAGPDARDVCCDKPAASDKTDDECAETQRSMHMQWQNRESHTDDKKSDEHNRHDRHAAEAVLWPALEKVLPDYPDIKVEIVIERMPPILFSTPALFWNKANFREAGLSQGDLRWLLAGVRRCSGSAILPRTRC